jgi:hypothetical protein
MKQTASATKTRANRRFGRSHLLGTFLELWNRHVFMTLTVSSSAASEAVFHVEKPVDEIACRVNPRYQQASIKHQNL